MQLSTKNSFFNHLCNFVQNYALFDALKKRDSENTVMKGKHSAFQTWSMHLYDQPTWTHVTYRQGLLCYYLSLSSRK